MPDPDEPPPPSPISTATAAAAGLFVLGLMGVVPSLAMLPVSTSSPNITTAAAVVEVFGPTFAVGLHAAETPFLYLHNRNRHQEGADSATSPMARQSAASGVPSVVVVAVVVVVLLLPAAVSPLFLRILAGLWISNAGERSAPAVALAVEDSGVCSVDAPIIGLGTGLRALRLWFLGDSAVALASPAPLLCEVMWKYGEAEALIILNE